MVQEEIFLNFERILVPPVEPLIPLLWTSMILILGFKATVDPLARKFFPCALLTPEGHL